MKRLASAQPNQSIGLSVKVNDMSSVAPTDHRPRVAAERRARMRQRLLEAALVVFAEKGITAGVIQDVVAAAEVSQGSFYNYFRTSDDLLQALADELSEEMMQMIEVVIADKDDPVLRLAIGIRWYLHLMRSYPLIAKFMAATALRVSRRDPGSVYLPRDLKAGKERGRLDFESIDLAVDLISGVRIVAVDRLANGKAPKDYPERIAGLILRSLGVAAKDLQALIAFPLPRLTALPDSLFSRAKARHQSAAVKSSTAARN